MSFPCPVPECRKVINGLTGLTELQNLVKHYKRAHLCQIDILQAAEIRARVEAEQDGERVGKRFVRRKGKR